jgi:hypothetical protein
MGSGVWFLIACDFIGGVVFWEIGIDDGWAGVESEFGKEKWVQNWFLYWRTEACMHFEWVRENESFGI